MAFVLGWTTARVYWGSGPLGLQGLSLCTEVVQQGNDEQGLGSRAAGSNPSSAIHQLCDLGWASYLTFLWLVPHL